MAVLAILVTLMMGLVTSATTLWRQSENRADAFREARAAFTVITRDLSSTLASTNTNFFLLNSAASSSLSHSSVEMNGQNRGALFALVGLPPTAQEGGKNKSDLCQVGYFLAFARTAMSTNLPGGQPSLNLYRYFLSSDPTFERLTNGAAPFFPTVTPDGANVELLARNIREFRVTPLVYSNNAYSTNFVPTTNKPVPDALEIAITAVNQEAARRFPNRADWVSPSPPAALTQAEQRFTTRVRLPQAPPAP